MSLDVFLAFHLVHISIYVQFRGLISHQPLAGRHIRWAYADIFAESPSFTTFGIIDPERLSAVRTYSNHFFTSNYGVNPIFSRCIFFLIVPATHYLIRSSL
jgi:hypothetical protein